MQAIDVRPKCCGPLYTYLFFHCYDIVQGKGLKHPTCQLILYGRLTDIISVTFLGTAGFRKILFLFPPPPLRA
jgi:hypothetical protein